MSALPRRPLLEGEYHLRPLVMADAQAWSACISDPRVHGPTSWDVQDAQEVQSLIRDIGLRGGWRWAIARAADDVLVGTCGTNRLGPGADVVEVGYELVPEVWGRGLATAAVTAFLDEARKAGLERVVAHTWVLNAPSERVLVRCGFERDAWLPAFRSCRGELRDFWRWSRPLHAS